MYNFKSKKLISFYIAIIFLTIFSNTCNIYGQNKNVTTEDIKRLNQSILTLTNSIDSILKNNTNAPNNNPVGNVTNLFGSIGPMIPIYFLAIVSMTMVIPLVIDMVMAYRRNSKVDADNIGTRAIGMEGLYRTLMTFGVVLLAGIVRIISSLINNSL